MRAVTKYTLANCLLAFLIISTFAFLAFNRFYAEELREANVNLESCIRTSWELLKHKGEEYRIVDGRLLAGDYVINDNFEVPDKVQEIFGGVATVFMGDTRVSTNVLRADGRRAIGTKLVGPAYDAIFKEGKPYRGEAKILGISYFTAYDPIRDSKGNIVGVLFVGVKKSEFLANFVELETELILLLSGLLVVFMSLMILLGRVINESEKSIENHLRFLRTLGNTIPIPIFYKDKCGRFLGCNNAYLSYVGLAQEELVGKTVHDLWPKEMADKYHQMDLDLYENGGVQVYESSVLYADNTLHDVVFNKAVFNDKNDTLGGLVGVILDITERKQAEAALVFRNILLSTQQEASIDGILVVDENARILSFNQRFIDIMNIPPRLLATREDEPVLQHVIGQVIDPESFLEKVRYLYAHQQETSRDELVLKDGKVLDRYSSPLLGEDGRYYGRFWSFHDITERKTAEENVKNAYQKMAAIIEFLPDATFVVDKDKRVIAWNRAVEEMTGVMKADILGKGDYEYSLPFYGERRPILIDLLDENPDALSKYVFIKKVGSNLIAESQLPYSFHHNSKRHLWGIASRILDKDGNPVGAIESIRDITEHKLAEEEKSRLEAQLHHSQMMESFMRQLGHDLQTPLTPLLTLLPLIKEKVSGSDLERMMDICCKTADQLHGVTTKTLQFVRLSSAAMPDELERVNLASLVENCCYDSKGLLAEKNAVCRNTIDPSIVVNGLSAQLGELFSNLIANAARYSRDRGTILIAAEPGEHVVTVSIKDDGIGLDPENLEHIFGEFFKADVSRHDLQTSGLGLSICKRIVLNHNGRIWAESLGKGAGTTIFLALPLPLST